ncbi:MULTISPECIES: DEAD/DEAH box helicase [unclassified Coleofasciculus]|uniref:DEAD/DEAH box helicase n=1 Tax=unclassified Coleofasciculus TaxID=2692782 RepID=UPI00187F30AC|nr:MULTISPECIES: DEAD/DEAH box helicase [unclassified Coleofasciculus]MBE9126717.1 DEAD/DEAH box helicase [Coleofasciculus sp. LEGE 07081]MBE9150077.1 DEAD/DEAH box helicase [Coleofasciculus sp. LEGE 07092]
MAILHGSWITGENSGHLFIWGEIWRTMSSVESPPGNGALLHPFAMTEADYIAFLNSQHLPIGRFLEVSENGNSGTNNRWQAQILTLPTQTLSPDTSAYPVLSVKMPVEETEQLKLKPWKIEGFYLEPLEAVQFLQALPLSSFQDSTTFVGEDLLFWAQVCRWSLDLLTRCKFLPGLYRQPDGEAVACWQPLLDSALDQARLAKFTQRMPSACRAYAEWQTREIGENIPNSPFPTPDSPQELLLRFLCSAIDVQVRHWGESGSLPTAASPIPEWLRSLSTESDSLDVEPTAVARLETALQSWTTPIQEHLVTPTSGELTQNLFRTCFVLQPPESDESNWRLDYCLQAVDNPEVLVEAKMIWRQSVERLEYQGRTIKLPQETFLKGLGLASRLYPAIEPSLHERVPSFSELTPVQVYEFIKASAWRLQDSGLGIILPPGLAPGAGARRLGVSIKAEVPSKKNERLGLQSLLKFKWELAIGDQTISKKEFDRLMAQKSPLVEVNGEWIALQPSDVRAAQTMLAASKEQMNLSVEDALRLSTGDTTTLGKLPVVKFEASGALQELIANLTGNQTVELIEIPESFNGTLRPYQLRGVSWLAFLERWGMGACLADDMGLGKTPQLIAFLLHLKEQEELGEPTLVVCPTSVLGNWEREVKRFAPTLKAIVHHGDKRPKGKAFVKAVKDKDMVITSYPLVYRDATALEQVSWRGVVLDEAQNIKNPGAKQSQAVRGLPTEFRIALTGTPVENRLSELWSILDFLNPAYLGDRQFFQRRFAMPIEKFGDRDSLQTLRSLVQPFILRRLKTDKTIIQDLPEKQEMTVFCGLSAEQATLYQKLVDESLVEIEAAEGIKRKGLILTLLLRLKQVCNHPAQLLKEKQLKDAKRSGKVLRLQEMLEEAISEGDRALIFTQFAEWGKLLQPYLEKQLGGEILFLYGATRKNQREEMIDRFQNDPEGPRILILSLKAGGTGLNLTRANHVFHIDRWWNPAVENQATDRAFRIGQTRNVQVHKFVCNGTLEEKINDIIESKKQLAEQTVEAGENWVTEMDTNQLRSLLLLDRNAVIDE